MTGGNNARPQQQQQQQSRGAARSNGKHHSGSSSGSSSSAGGSGAWGFTKPASVSAAASSAPSNEDVMITFGDFTVEETVKVLQKGTECTTCVYACAAP